MNILKNAKVTEVIKPKMINTKDGQKKVSGLVFEETFTTKEGKEIKKYLKLDFWEDDSRLLQDIKVGQVYSEVKANVKSRKAKDGNWYTSATPIQFEEAVVVKTVSSEIDGDLPF